MFDAVMFFGDYGQFSRAAHERKTSDCRERSAPPLFDADVFDHLTLDGALQSRDVLGGTAPARVQEALARVKT